MEKFLMFLKEKRILCSFLFLALLTGTFFTLYIVEVTAEEAYTCPKLAVDMDETESKEDEVIVDVKGAVVNPGVYRVKKGTIIQEDLNLAGVITVFTKEEIKHMNVEKEPIHEDTPNDSKPENNGLISLNHATLEELMELPGIGEAKARIIIEYRENCGKFKKKEELKNIKGIGEKVYEKLESYITI